MGYLLRYILLVTLIAPSAVLSLPQSPAPSKASADGQCGGEFTCITSTCGNTEEHCGPGCNPAFGLCDIPASSTFRTVTQQPATSCQKTETVFRTSITNVTQTVNKTEIVERTVLLFSTSTVLQTSTILQTNTIAASTMATVTNSDGFRTTSYNSHSHNDTDGNDYCNWKPCYRAGDKDCNYDCDDNEDGGEPSHQEWNDNCYCYQNSDRYQADHGDCDENYHHCRKNHAQENNPDEDKDENKEWGRDN
ncbi:LOW QUALITY PROTEIN: uncharacterized protein QC763_0077290 [Podospora pseudopauciseta]|uniref:Chitin-binding type-1 domain-containing protein n=1 Tax=Podospora pseudopauciseta TaxID=2093780 RepID=A0ABR0HAN9_9PEZI|nr:LOW QUALITY PROTEIN: hypothetical protein QC763_0077290 [Podospora pseudopauciseta]